MWGECSPRASPEPAPGQKQVKTDHCSLPCPRPAPSLPRRGAHHPWLVGCLFVFPFRKSDLNIRVGRAQNQTSFINFSLLVSFMSGSQVAWGSSSPHQQGGPAILTHLCVNVQFQDCKSSLYQNQFKDSKQSIEEFCS